MYILLADRHTYHERYYYLLYVEFLRVVVPIGSDPLIGSSRVLRITLPFDAIHII